MRAGPDDPLLLKAFGLAAISADERFGFVAEISLEIMGTTANGDISHPMVHETCHVRASFSPFGEPDDVWQHTDFESKICEEQLGQMLDAWKALPRGELATGSIDERAHIFDCVRLGDREALAVFECRSSLPLDLPESIRWGAEHSVYDLFIDLRNGRLISSTSHLTAAAKHLKNNLVEEMTTNQDSVVFRSGVTRTRQMTGVQSGVSKSGLQSMRYRMLTTVNFRFPGVQMAE